MNKVTQKKLFDNKKIKFISEFLFFLEIYV